MLPAWSITVLSYLSTLITRNSLICPTLIAGSGGHGAVGCAAGAERGAFSVLRLRVVHQAHGGRGGMHGLRVPAVGRGQKIKIIFG